MINAVIFDIDGTLMDSQWMWRGLASRYLLSQGCTPEEGLDEKLSPMSIRQGCEYLIAVYHLPFTPDQVSQGLGDLIADFYQNQSQLKPNALSFLQQLRENGVKLCLVTATPRRLCLPALERCGVTEYMEFLLTVDEFGVGKDRPDIFFHAMERLGGTLDTTLVFEDAPHAVETAHRAGFSVVGIADPTAERSKVEPFCQAYWEGFPQPEKAMEQLEQVAGGKFQKR
jgi:HAD superfamily hydrolase (TIGR01509 family)